MKIIKAFMRFFFHHLYHGCAWSYDFVAWAVSLGRWNDWVHAALDFTDGPRVLELGFGPGHLQLALHEKGIASFGLDESPQMTVQATRRLGHRGYQPRLTRGIAQHLPFASARFNTVVATFPSEYITTPETIAEIYRVLIPNGRLVILAHATFAGNNFSERIAGWLFRITGQAADTARQIVIFEKLLFPFREAGFDLDFAERKVRGSTLFFVSARKQIAVSAQPTLR